MQLLGRDGQQVVATDSSKLPDNHREWTEDQRQLFVKHLRFQFCRRADFPETSEMLNADGSFNDKYFETQVVEQAERKWTENERKLLLKGIEEYGIGHFGEISAALLPEWVCVLCTGAQQDRAYHHHVGAPE